MNLVKKEKPSSAHLSPELRGATQYREESGLGVESRPQAPALWEKPLQLSCTTRGLLTLWRPPWAQEPREESRQGRNQE